jgi:hypothetical protein
MRWLAAKLGRLTQNHLKDIAIVTATVMLHALEVASESNAKLILPQTLSSFHM